MELPPQVHCELRRVRRAFVATFAKGDQMELAAHYSHAFEELRVKFSHSIYLVPPEDNQYYIIKTDASVKAVGAVLTQKSKEGRTNVVSTNSRVLTPAERK